MRSDDASQVGAPLHRDFLALSVGLVVEVHGGAHGSWDTTVRPGRAWLQGRGYRRCTGWRVMSAVLWRFGGPSAVLAPYADSRTL